MDSTLLSVPKEKKKKKSKINQAFLSIHLAVFISSINIQWKTKEKLLVFLSRESETKPDILRVYESV